MRRKKAKKVDGKGERGGNEKTIQSYLASLNRPTSSGKRRSGETKRMLLANIGADAEKLARIKEMEAGQWLLRLKRERGDVQQEVLNRAMMSPIASKRLFGEGVNTKTSDLGRWPQMPWDGNLLREIKWATAIAIFHAESINAITVEISKFERMLAAGDYDEARVCHENIVKKNGQSIWAIETEILLEECSKGLEANKRAAKKRGSEANDELTKALIDCISQKCELGLSEGSYEHEFGRFIAPLDKRDPNGIFTGYFRFHLNRYSQFEYTEEHLAFVLHHDSTFPFVDFYKSLVGVLRLSIFKPINPEILLVARESIARLREVIQDRQLVGVSWVADPNQSTRVHDCDSRLVRSIEAYTVGDYITAKETAEELINSGSYISTACEIIACAEISDGQQTKQSYGDHWLAENVIKLTRSIVRRSDTSQSDISRLRRLGQTVSACSFGYELHSLALLIGGKGQHNERMFAAIHSTAVTPRMGLAYQDSGFGQIFLDRIGEAWGNTATHSLFRSMIVNTPIPSAVEELLPASRVHKYLAAKAENSGALQDAIALLETLQSISGTNRYILSYAAERLASLYMRSERVGEAAALIVDLYLRDPHLLNTASVSQLTGYFEQNGWISDPVLLPTVVLYYIKYNKAAPRERRASLFTFYQSYLNQHGVMRPSELPLPHTDRDRTLAIFFLRHICVHDIMDSSYLAFSSSLELDAERIKICQLLVKLDPLTEQLYTFEIATIVTAQAVTQMINKVGQAKIYVDEDALIRSLGESYRELFDRFCQVRALGKDLRSLIQVLRKQNDKEVQLFIITDIVPTLFVELFNEIKTRFVSSSEYGLETYLSARIRHGTLSGEIRSQFGKLRLVTKKPFADKEIYEPNTYWYNLYEVRNLMISDIQSLDDHFQAFSKEIDNIIDLCNNTWFRIRNDSERKEGMFNYDFSEKLLLEMYIEIGSNIKYEDFISYCLDTLWRRTSENLERIQHLVRGEVTTRISTAINRLEDSIFNTAPHLRGSDLAANIVTSRTKMQLQLEAVANWFRIAEPTDIADFKLDIAINTAIAIVANSYPEHPLDVHSDFDIQGLCSGPLLYSYIDLLGIFLHNIIKHGDPLSQHVDLACHFRPGKLILRISNRLPPQKDLASARQQAMEAKAKFDLRLTAPLVQAEGKSGYPKLARTLWNDLKVHDCSIALDVLDDYTFCATLQATWNA